MSKPWRNLLTGLAFLSPNILGVLAFTVFPVLFSLAMAFTNWDLTQHNMFKPDASVQFVGGSNFRELASSGEQLSWDSKFVRYLGNTLFLMMGIPVSVCGSLVAAILLSRETRAGGGRPYAWLLAGAVLVSACALLAALGLGATAMVMLFVAVASTILVGGVAMGRTFYRTLFYTPHFVAGVATFILWKKLYNKDTGPINQAVQPVLDQVAGTVNAVPPAASGALLWVGLGAGLAVLAGGLGRLRRMHLDGDLGAAAAVLPLGLVGLPTLVGLRWDALPAGGGWFLAVGAGVVLAYQGLAMARATDRFACPPATGFGSAMVIALLAMVGQFVLLGLSAVAGHLPAMAADGLEAPSWLNSYEFAKPALMIMAFWAAIGSNNMLLYLAALTNIPGELYEAADIDGASPLQRFWNVTWPQLAPTTFFIMVMATISGLQGGFESARVMTEGGPAGATTTLSYFIYTEGFETGRLGYASAVAWVLFVLVFSVTLFNWKFGSRYVND